MGRTGDIYRVVLNKCSLSVDRCSGGVDGPEEQYRGISAIFAHFGHIFISFVGNIPSGAGRIYISQSVYSAVYSMCIYISMYRYMYCSSKLYV